MHTNSLFSAPALLTLLPLLLGSSQGDEPVPIQTAIDARVYVNLEQALLVEIERRVTGEMTLFDGERVISREVLTLKEDTRLLDRIEHLDGLDERSSRTYARTRTTLNGEVADEPFNGLTLNFNRVGDTVEIAAADGRSLPEGKMTALIEAQTSVGMPAELPESILVGESFDSDLKRLGAVLLDPYLSTTSGSGSLTLTRLTDEGVVAVFEGPMKFVQEGDIDPSWNGRADYTVDCELRVDLVDQRIARIKLEGSVRYERVRRDASGVRMHSESRYTAEVTTSLGRKRDAALKEKTVFRKKRFRGSAGLFQLTLPSYYDALVTEDGHMCLERCLDTGRAQISVQSGPSIRGLDADEIQEVMLSIEQTLADKGAREVKSVTSRSGLGKGRSYRYVVDDGPRCMEVYPLDGRLVMFKLTADEEAVFDKAYREFKRSRSTLKRLND